MRNRLIFERKAIKQLLYLVFLGVVFLVGYFNNKYLPQVKSEVATNTPITSSLYKNIYYIGKYTVDHITDGDTVHVKDNSGKEDVVRLLVVNTPEIHTQVNGKVITERDICLGKIAKEFTSSNLLNRQVYLWGDGTQPKRDKYNRLLAYVQVVEVDATSTVFFNDLLMQKGIARIYKATPPGTNYQKYLQYQLEAEKEKLGIWNTELCK